jgi:hypothetical protein
LLDPDCTADGLLDFEGTEQMATLPDSDGTEDGIPTGVVVVVAVVIIGLYSSSN